MRRRERSFASIHASATTHEIAKTSRSDAIPSWSVFEVKFRVAGVSFAGRIRPQGFPFSSARHEPRFAGIIRPQLRHPGTILYGVARDVVPTGWRVRRALDA